jgi:hypothetical protein
VKLCEHNSTCLNTYGSYTCICPDGSLSKICEQCQV